MSITSSPVRYSQIGAPPKSSKIDLVKFGVTIKDPICELVRETISMKKAQDYRFSQCGIFIPYHEDNFLPDKLKSDLEMLASKGKNILHHDFGFSITGEIVMDKIARKAHKAYQAPNRVCGRFLSNLLGLNASSLGDPQTKTAPVNWPDPCAFQIPLLGERFMTEWMVLHALQADGYIRISENSKKHNSMDAHLVKLTDKGLDYLQPQPGVLRA